MSHKKVYTQEQIEQFLSFIEQGLDLSKCEKALGYTGIESKLRRIIRQQYPEHYEQTMKNAAKSRSQYMLKNNPVTKSEVRQKISQTVKQQWQDGHYQNRINGMLGRTKFDSTNFKLGKRNYFEICSEIHDTSTCFICGNDNLKVDIHHIDENWNNWCKTNLVPLCVGCHQKFHYKSLKLEYDIYKYHTNIFIDNNEVELLINIILRKNMFEIFKFDIEHIINNEINKQNFKDEYNVYYNIFEHIINQQLKGVTHIEINDKCLSVFDYISYLIENKRIS